MENVSSQINKLQYNKEHLCYPDNNIPCVVNNQTWTQNSQIVSTDRCESLKSSPTKDLERLIPEIDNILRDNNDINNELTHDGVMLSPPTETDISPEDLEQIENARFISQHSEQEYVEMDAHESVDNMNASIEHHSEIDTRQIQQTEFNMVHSEERANADECTTMSVTNDDIVKQQVLEQIFGNNQNNKGNVYGDINIENSDHVRIGNVTYITGPVHITQNITTVTQQNIRNQLYVNANRVALKRLNIINRRSWLAQPPMEDPIPISLPVKFVIISHTATESGLTQADNVLLIRLTQTFHIESRGWCDIAYNFLIGCDGSVYEGRGWKMIGSHTFGYNSQSIGISFVGCFMKNLPPQHSLDACQLLIQTGIDEGYIDKNYILLGHCQCSAFESPGKRLFEEIKTWAHWHDIYKDTEEK